MTEAPWQPTFGYTGGEPPGHAGPGSSALVRPEPSNLADVLERVLDKGVVIAGDIRVDLVDVELLTIRIRLLVASVDRAREMGIDWWTKDPMLSSEAEDSPRRQEHKEGHRPRARRHDGAGPGQEELDEQLAHQHAGEQPEEESDDS